MLTVAAVRSWGACNISFWTDRCYQRAGRGFSTSWRADSSVCRLINLIIESSCSTLIRAWWKSWEDSLSTVTSLYDFFETWDTFCFAGSDYGFLLPAPICWFLIAACILALFLILHWSHYGHDIVLLCLGGTSATASEEWRNICPDSRYHWWLRNLLRRGTRVALAPCMLAQIDRCDRYTKLKIKLLWLLL